MSWSKRFTEKIAEALRYAAYLFLALDAIVLSGFVFWLLVKLVWRFGEYINHLIFENPWF